jgi:hypothetical protein
MVSWYGFGVEKRTLTIFNVGIDTRHMYNPQIR